MKRCFMVMMGMKLHGKKSRLDFWFIVKKKGFYTGGGSLVTASFGRL